MLNLKKYDTCIYEMAYEILPTSDLFSFCKVFLYFYVQPNPSDDLQIDRRSVYRTPAMVVTFPHDKRFDEIDLAAVIGAPFVNFREQK